VLDLKTGEGVLTKEVLEKRLVAGALTDDEPRLLDG
jgi:hypothetical protein